MKKLQIMFHKLQKVIIPVKIGLIACLLLLSVGIHAQENEYENDSPFKSSFEEYNDTWLNSGRLPDDGGTENPPGSETDFPVGPAPVLMLLLLGIAYQYGKLKLKKIKK